MILIAHLEVQAAAMLQMAYVEADLQKLLQSLCLQDWLLASNFAIRSSPVLFLFLLDLMQFLHGWTRLLRDCICTLLSHFRKELLRKRIAFGE